MRLSRGVELLDRYDRSGCTDAPYLIRRGDGRMLEVSALLHLVAVAIDGERTVPEIAAVVGRDSGRGVTAENVAYLINEKLSPLGIVEGVGGATVRPPSPRRPLALSLRAGVIPRRVVGAVATLLRPLFLPPAVLAALVALVVVDGWLLLGDEVPTGLRAVVEQPSLVLLVVALTVLAGAFHELGHATASRYGGAEPGVIGVGIYLAWPVFYNDLNDSYRLDRRGRLRADLGGVYFNVIFILIVAVAYAVTSLEALVVVIATQHLAMLQQFLPFLRLDGYYVVSDLAGVPDLFGRIRPVLFGLLGRRGRHGHGRELTPRASRIVTLWVLVTVPLLSACLALLVLRAPHLAVVAWESASIHAAALAGAWRTGTPLPAAVSALQLVMLAIPITGLLIALANAVRRWAGSRGGAGALPAAG